MFNVNIKHHNYMLRINKRTALECAIEVEYWGLGTLLNIIHGLGLCDLQGSDQILYYPIKKLINH